MTSSSYSKTTLLYTGGAEGSLGCKLYFFIIKFYKLEKPKTKFSSANVYDNQVCVDWRRDMSRTVCLGKNVYLRKCLFILCLY